MAGGDLTASIDAGTTFRLKKIDQISENRQPGRVAEFA